MSQSGGVPQIDPNEAQRRVTSGGYLLDVREPDEWQAGHAPSAHHVPLAEVAAALSQLALGLEVVVVCRSGGRSQRAAEFLAAQGVAATNLAGGMRAWAAEALPVVTEDGSPGSVI